MRLIDAEKLRAEYLGMPNCYNGYSDSYDKAMIVDIVDEQPTIDAVPVVRCKDCKHYRSVAGYIDGYCHMAEWYRRYQYPDDYCSRGERKDDE